METTHNTHINDEMSPETLLQWYVEMGADECILNESVDRYAYFEEQRLLREQQLYAPSSKDTVLGGKGRIVPEPTGGKTVSLAPTDEVVRKAVALCEGAKDIASLELALHTFEGPQIKNTAMNTVFVKGHHNPDVLVIGGAPGKEEDRQGKPFVGEDGLLLDKMLASINLDPETVLFSNVIFWRPPGDRNPVQSEVAMCLPFIERLITLADPKVILLLGEFAARTILGKSESLSQMRAKWFDHQVTHMSHPIKASVLYHPQYLLNSPAQKRRAWQDLNKIADKLKKL